MHRRITEAIVEALNKYDDKRVSFVVVKNCKSDGFWSLKVTVKAGYCHKLTSIERIGLEIGRFYDEGLSVEKMRHVLIFS